MTSEHHIRPATIEDAEAITRLHIGGWQVHYRGILPDEYLDALDFEERLAARKKRLSEPAPAGTANWVLEEDGVIRGWAATGYSRDEDLAAPEGAGPAEIAYELYAIYLVPDLVGRGYGRALMQHCLEEARRRGHPEMVMWVLTGNERARRFYAAAGFEPDPRVASVPFRDTGQTKLRLQRPLGQD